MIRFSESVQHLMKTFKPKIIFACESVVDILYEAAELEKVNTIIVVFGKHKNFHSLDEILQAPSQKEVESFQPNPIEDPKSAALIVLSSGSSGLPKGIVHPYENIFNIISTFMHYPLSKVSLWNSACYWITYFGFVFESIFSRGTRIIIKNFDPEDTCQIIEKYKV